MSFNKPMILYKYQALEPYIDAETMEVHYEKHHSAYVSGLNGLSDAGKYDNTMLASFLSGLFKNEGISEEDKKILLNHGGGHFNHSLFWEFMSPKSSEKDISHFLAERIAHDFKTLENFKKEFSDAALKVFGSGWAWYVFDKKQNKSYITTTKDQINPVMENPDCVCMLGLDVWEHAYYIRYRNERARYINSWWNVVNWEMVSQLHDKVAMAGEKLSLTVDGYIDLPDRESYE
ncbi:superoxide dismutase, Fe-Mn family [Enteropsectra breve]|nr:superoxide dismutase, Fe-Mn family [Enteropsectra breve]